MSTKTTSKAQRWIVPVFALVIGVAMFVVGTIAEDVWLGLIMFAIMAAYATILVVFRRSEPVAMLGEEGGDERRRMIQLRAGSFTTNVLAIVVVGGFFVDVLRGGDGEPWTWLGLIGGVSFVGSLVVLSRRS